MIAPTDDRAAAFTAEPAPTTDRTRPAQDQTAEKKKRRVTVPREKLAEIHSVSDAPVTKQIADFVLFFAAAGVAVWSWYAGLWPVTVVAWLVGGFFGLTKPLTFHDFAHKTMFKENWKNEVGGTATGTLIMVPLTAYRVAHRRHHAHLATEKDPELWPFTSPKYSRTFRLFSAFAETVFGMVYTPLLFLRDVLTADSISADEYRKIGREYVLIVLFWGGLLGSVHLLGAWELFLVGYIAPVAIAGAFQTLNKYVEHLGLHGHDTLANTRNVVHPDPLGTFCSWWMQNIDHHGSHHIYAKVPYDKLPETSDLIYTQEVAADAPNYVSYWSAAWEMVKSLPNPHAGPAWTDYYRGRA